MEQVRQLMGQVFGFRAFRGIQEAVIQHVLTGGDALVIMPTGGGKSLCYQLPALIRPGLGVVISPLIALMQDQVNSLKQLGVRAEFINSSLSGPEFRYVEERVENGEVDLLYMAPERLLMERNLEWFSRLRLSLFAIDESHCVSQWGHDFRPEYLELHRLGQLFPGVPRLALTATADGPTRQDILERLDLTHGRLFIAGFDRPNIRYHVVAKEGNSFNECLSFIRQHHEGQSGIIYHMTRKDTEETAQKMREKGYNALPYHAGMEQEERRRNQARFLKEEGVVMVATVAFGMGIDKPDVRFVAHLDLPKSVESYYQETGRAGRDGLPADAWLAYGLSDVVRLRQLVEGSEADDTHKRVALHKLEALLGYCETMACRRQVLLNYFENAHLGNCGNCDNCLSPAESWDGTEAARKALSCIYRTGQCFGVAHLVEVLRGEMSEKVVKHAHHQVTTFGIGKEMDVREWRAVFRQLVAAGYAQVDVTGYGGLRLDPSSRPILRGETTLMLRRDVARKQPRRRKTTTTPATKSSASGTLWDALRAKRLELAKEQSIPPYMIFSDVTLREMESRKPTSMREMADVFGIGQVKLERYGAIFLQVVKNHKA
ncbi:MAG: DNA helicase RecQ [Magnetococcales bacterium]|nr:DNA helicase RecQ [Magnetococcales bacterium]NGZ26805.1 DNA helicase RecQ [Magnetococcales bacterium]